MTNIFEEIDKQREDLPKIQSIAKEVGKHKLNYYQLIAVCIFTVLFFAGIILGNIFPACSSTGELFSDVCTKTEFNTALTIFVWFVSFIGCMFIYAIGEIIEQLRKINVKLSKTTTK